MSGGLTTTNNFSSYNFFFLGKNIADVKTDVFWGPQVCYKQRFLKVSVDMLKISLDQN